MDLANVKLRVGTLIQRAKDQVKETEGIHLRSKVLLEELNEVQNILNEPATVVTTTTNAECFKDQVVVTVPTPTAKPPEAT
jgi:glycerol-3-phosphate responsive antiterminator